jgi:CheY-like chemotaxis protein
MAKVLVADDQKEIREVLRNVLEEAGHEVRLAKDGDEALRAQNESPADVVITDLHMPRLNGLELVHALREGSRSVRIIAMSGGDNELADRNLQGSIINGADFTLSKPFPMRSLLRAIESLLAPAQA